MWTEWHCAALRSVFRELNSTKLQWMILRNYDGLPEHNRSKDIDLLFYKSDFDSAKDVIIRSLRKIGFSHYYETKYQYAWCLTFFSAMESSVYSLKIDLLDGFVWRGAQIVSPDDLFQSRVQHDNFFVPDPVYDAFMLWIKPLMTGGFVKEKYRYDIINALEKWPEKFRSLTLSAFGAEAAAKVWPLLEAKNVDETVLQKKPLCRAAWLHRMRNAIVKTAGATLEHFGREILRRFFRPKASMISVAGPDGAGKTTFITVLQQTISNCLIRDLDDVRVLHHRPNVFPNLKKLFKGKKYAEDSEEFQLPHRAVPAGTCSSIFRLIYYWSDYILGYWLFIRKQAVAGKILIFDRYFYDFLVDPHRSRINLPNWIRRFFLIITPEPDIVFLLLSDAETIFSRKKELSFDELHRQIEDYRKLANRNKRFVILDAKKEPYKLANDALLHLIRRSYKAL